jgi:ubiquinol-cytochrome c reductase iron-sulfur subunit
MPHERWNRLERQAALAFGISAVASVALAAVYWSGGQPQAEGVLLGVVLIGIGVGLGLWAKHGMVHGPFSEPRGEIASREEEVQAFLGDLESSSGPLIRRRVLGRMLLGALASLGLAALFPIRSLGPRPGSGLKSTAYRKGTRLVTVDNEPVRADALAVDGVLTVFPQDNTEAGDAPTLLLHLRPGQDKPRADRRGYALGDLVAYSKVCSHMGCPVGLYQAEIGLLLCPCHQSTFDVGHGCKPVFGPATRALVQLPIDVDADGYLIAKGDFSGPVGPGFWDRDR